MQFSNILPLINKAESVLIITHENPDGDALGSMLALGQIMEAMGKKSDHICIDPVPRAFEFLHNTQKIKKDFLCGDYDLIFILDCGDLRRTGFPDRLKEFSRHKKKIINIDHHPKNDLHKIARFNLVDYDCSSTSEIVFNLIRFLKINIDPKIATSLLCGIYTDTGAFQHSNTSVYVMEIASYLLKKGAKLKEITTNIANGKSVSALKLWGIVLSRANKNEEYGIVSSVITQKDITDCGATQSDLAGAVNVINSIPDSKAAILFYEMPDGLIKASVRTESNSIDVSQLARIFGGGGLKKASGFTIDGKIVKTIRGWKIR